MKLELTDQQEEAVKNGRTVEVVDPGTAKVFVILAREQYDRVRPFLEGSPVQSPCAPRPPAAPAEEEAVRVCLRDLPTPTDVGTEAERWCEKYGRWGEEDRREVEEQLKLQYYYGGQGVYVLPTAAGPVVIPIPERHKNTSDLRYLLLQPEERSRAYYTVPSRWRDTAGEVLSS
jgi:hypothetical protein